VPISRRIRQMFYKSLVGLSVAGCLLSIAFVGGAAAVAYYVFSKPPRVAVSAPLPTSLTRTLRARRALLTGDVALSAYRPAGQEDTTLLLLTRRRTVVVTPNQVRSYNRDSVRSDMDMVIHGGLSFRLVLYGAQSKQVADTVFRSLSFRDWVQLRSQLKRPDEKTAPRAAPAPSRTRPRSRR
jgi:hypothetical protein